MPKENTFLTQGPRDTAILAERLAGHIKKMLPGVRALVVGLEGELGAGKTTFVKGFVKAMGSKSKVHSPTFIIARELNIKDSNFKKIIHIDAYRLNNHRDLFDIGLEESIADPSNILLIEWSDRVKKIFPKKYIQIHIDHVAEKKRKIEIKYINFEKTDLNRW